MGSQTITVTAENAVGIAKSLPFHLRFIIRALAKLRYGSIRLRTPDGRCFAHDAPEKGPDAEIILKNWKLPRRLLTGGSIGAAESFMDGDWDSPDVTELLSLFAANEEVFDTVAVPNWINNAIETMRHWLNQNSRRGSKRNIAAHYDLGNAFYSKWLDASMTYSSAIFERGTNSLRAAQQAKYRSLAENIDLRENHHVLEIGCGWGGFAEYAAKNVGCRVTGLTISREQYDYARERMFRQGLNEKVEIKFQDYRDETGVYDRIASIEMFEAVGEKFWPAYFAKLQECLKKGGKAGLQIITIPDRHFEAYRRRPDFIQRYIFPGGMLPSPAILSKLSSDASLRLAAERIFPHDYARTLADWRRRFHDAWEEIKPLGFDERFRKMWAFYLHYCEAGFLHGNIDVRQIFYERQ